DENDNAPVFNQRVYNADVTEDTKIDTSILSVGAKDNDITFNQLTYRLNPFSSIFRINSKDGKIYLASPLDREKISAYNLTVEAMDNGTPSKSGSAEINIQIKDINDEKPELIIKNNDIKIKENITIGSIIATLNATDEDLDAKLVFRIVQQKNELDGKGREVNEISKSDNFEINSTTGDITVKKELNREEFERISLELRVTDNNTVIGDNYDTKFLKITILDVNDCAPVFRKQSHSLNVIENYPLHDNFATFQATDEDVNDNVTYTIIDQSNKFNITPSTGSIFLVDRLDREEEANLTFTIVASDSGSPPLSSSINISVTVKDFNDNAPEFQNVLKSIAVPEDTAINSTIARIHARDNDTGIHASITYQLDQIVPRAVNSPFTIDMLSGNISLKENIDRETVEVYTVRIFAQDNYNRATKFQEPGWKRSSAILIINITDINDHSPQFNSIACQNVQEDMIGSIMTITATDKDIGRNNKVEYSIFGNESALFKIDPQSGKLSVNSSLTNKVGLKYFTVEATDKGTPALNSSTSVCINVTDINNNPPTFSMTHDNVTVSESVCVGSEIYTLHAIDADYGINKKISYKLENFEDDSFFKIDDSKLILNKKLDYESKPKYQVKIKATDSGKPKLTSSDFFLTVFVENINDEPPEFSETFKNVTLEEGPAQRKFGPFEATHSGFKLCYNLSNTSDSQYFTVNQSTAFIETNQEIDYESKKSFEIELVVKTCSELQFNSSCSDSSKNNKNNKLTINVTVTDIDDNPPKFTQKSYSQAIVFDISKEERIFDLTPHVRDRDTLPENKKHKFSINSTTNFGNEALQQIKVPFRIRDNSVHSNVDFDSNVGGRVQLKIMVEDGNNMNDTAMLNIHILSEKDKVTIQFKLNADSVRKSKEDFVKFIQGLLGDKFVVIPGKIDVLNKGNGEVDSSRSTMGLYAIKNNTNEVLPPEKLLSFLDSRRLINEAQFGKFAVENVKENAPVVSEDPEEKTLMILIPIIVLLALIVIVLIMVFHASVVRYNRKLRAAETNSRPLEKPEEVRYPGTNVFSEGQINPLYNNMEDADTAAPLPDKLSLSSQILDVNQITTNMDDLNDINNTYEMPMDNSRVDLINVLSEREAALNVQNIQYDNNDEDYYDDIEVTDV
ncbi:protocadherin Fat 4-like, partial [Argonauta hians]